MTFKTTKLRDAITLALFVGASSLAVTGIAVAQETDDAQPQQETATTLDRIEVTGSRIIVPGLTANSPIVGLERDEIQRSQPITAEEFIRQLPGVTTPIGPGTNNGSDGGARLDLRSLGSNRSVVLLDGRRLVPYTLAGQVDINTIPVSLIQSVDIVTGGASAVYGADAIGGVANFILRRDFEGLEISSSYGQSHKNDQARQRNDVTIGANLYDGRGNVVLSVGHTKADPLTQGEREIGLASLSSVTGNPQGSATAVPSVFLGFPTGAINPETGLPAVGNRVIDTTTGEMVPYDPAVHSFNFNPQNYFYTPMDRYQATALGRFEINRHAEAYAQMLYTRSEVELNLASSGLFLNGLDITIGNPFIPEAARQQLCFGNGIAAADCVVGNTDTVVVTPGRRLVELGPRINTIDTKTFQYTVGLRGDITDNWRYDAYWSHGESDQDSARINWGSLSKTRQALLAVDPNECLDTSNGCVPLDIWGPEGSITPEMIGFINLSSYSKQSVVQEVLAGTVSGDLGDFKSPWSDYPVGLAFGVESRKATAETRADAASQIQGEVMGTGAPFPDRRGGFRLQEAYGEALVPLLSGMTAASSLNLELGYRYSDFSIEGNSFDYSTYKYGLEWAPIETLRFRGMFQHATRAPSIGELFAPAVTGLANLDTDPCAGSAISPGEANTAGTLANLCRLTGVPVNQIGSLAQPSAGQVNVRTGGNRLLEPEKADTRTIGFVWSPTFTNDLVVTFDYWKIELEEMVSTPAVGDILDGCYSTAFNPGLTFNSLCELVLRSPSNGGFNSVDSDGIVLAQSNLGRLSTDGYDLGVHYGLNLPESYGRLGFRLDASKVTSHDFQATPASINRDCLGYYSTDCGVGPHKFRANLSTVWSLNDLEFSMRWRHTGKMELEGLQQGDFLEDFEEISAYNYFDLGMAYNAPFNARFSLNVNNVANKKPPLVGNTIGTTTTNSGNTFPQTYDVIGRYITLGATFTF
ncbi:TonB-dependent receptor [Luteimonas sp. SJ-92]|uniref:TonB-dependent receptor n=1 Tax=Luteimonas salinisoli TaxID=2752307 RepID=A0A853JIL8_9GAMM|nr:TonB-dependent receptor [Luteimonas salinisoli]NZA28288.1 TonB-dependent receptor [Luteimonas salinisoli]